MSVLLDHVAEESFDFIEGLMADKRPEFVSNLERYFGFHQSQEIVRALEKLMIRLPQRNEEYIEGTDGIIIFSNEHAAVIRIELQDRLSARNVLLSSGKCKILPDSLRHIMSKHMPRKSSEISRQIRIDDSPWVLRPLASVAGRDYKIEILPGVHFENKLSMNRHAYRGLLAEGNHYWDARVDNIGRLPFPTPEFPDGVPVVVDRMAVERLSGRIDPVKTALFEMKCRLQQYGYSLSEVFSRATTLKQKLTDYISATVYPKKDSLHMESDPQDVLYGSLKKSFSAAWPQDQDSPDPEKMKFFWEALRAAKQEGRLIAGWNDAVPTGSELLMPKSKTAKAAKSAAAYQNGDSVTESYPCSPTEEQSSGARKFTRRASDRQP